MVARSTIEVRRPVSSTAAIDLVKQVRLDRDQDHLNLLARAASDELVIPDYFVDRKRNILLRLEGNDPLDLFLADRRQFHEAGEDGLLRDGVVERLRP